MKFIITETQLRAILSEQTKGFDAANIKVPSVSSPNEELLELTNIVNQSQDIKDLGEPPLTPEKVGNLYSCGQEVYESKVPPEHRRVFNKLKNAIENAPVEVLKEGFKKIKKYKEEFKKIKKSKEEAKQKPLTEQAEIPAMVFGINTTVLVIGTIAGMLLLLILAKFVKAIITGERRTYRVPCTYR